MARCPESFLLSVIGNDAARRDAPVTRDRYPATRQALAADSGDRSGSARRPDTNLENSTLTDRGVLLTR